MLQNGFGVQYLMHGTHQEPDDPNALSLVKTYIYNDSVLTVPYPKADSRCTTDAEALRGDKSRSWDNWFYIPQLRAYSAQWSCVNASNGTNQCLEKV